MFNLFTVSPTSRTSRISPTPSLFVPFGRRMRLMLVSAFCVLLFTACTVSDPHEHDEGELITSLRLVLTPTTGGSSDTVWFRDPDGPGGSAPTDHDTLRLVAGRTYAVSLSFLDESSAQHVVDMTEEIRDEAADHQVFYTVAGTGLAIAYADADENGLPVGLEAVFTTTAGSPGAVTVTLKHQPGLKSENSTISTGETDVSVTFVVVMTEQT